MHTFQRWTAILGQWVFMIILHVKCRDTLVADNANTWIIATIQTASDEQQTRTTEILCLNSTIDVLRLVVYVRRYQFAVYYGF